MGHAVPDDPFAARRDGYLAHNETIRGLVRHTLVARQLVRHLPEPPARVADIGGGDGRQSVPLAQRGYEVALLDPSDAMLQRARQRLADEPPDVQRRVRLLQGYGEDAPGLLGERSVDVALCHGVLMYIEDPRPLIDALARLTQPGGIISVLTKNADALAMRSAFEGRYRDALTALDADRDRGGMGVTRADRLDDLLAMLNGCGFDLEAWYGVRVFTDHLGNQPPNSDIDDILELEWQAGCRDPYRRVARLIHVVARRDGNRAASEISSSE
jgi:SAM-dependent methyltransferase